jgi:hypothetical protein
MRHPVVDIAMPASLAGQPNGRLNPGLLVAVDDHGNLLEAHAAVAWFAMDAACFAATGKHLKIGNSYRPIETQIAWFVERYSTTYDPLAQHVVWNGRDYYKRAGQNTAAVPGNSNHGLGLAVDTADETTYDPDVSAWLLEHAAEYGWSWEQSIDSSEPWHLHYFAGDNPPVPASPTHEVDDMEWRILQPAGSAALFIAPMAKLPDGTLAALYATWLPTGDKVQAFESRGVTRLELGVEDLVNVTLLGPLPTGDVRTWTAADWLAVA